MIFEPNFTILGITFTSDLDIMTISILGCGWLGLPLGERLLGNGNTIEGSTTSEEKLSLLKDRGIKPFLITLDPELHCDNCKDFWQADVLVLNIPPSRGEENVMDFYIKQITAVIEKLEQSPISLVVFASSTSVYPDKSGIVDEVDAKPGKAKRNSGNALLEAEQLLLSQKEFKTTVLRFGGLYGYDRHPAKYLAGRKNLERGNAPVNLIHRDDCIAIIQKIIEENVTGQIFNAVSDGHPPKKMYYPAVAKALGLQPPTFKEDSGKNYKIVSNEKLRLILNYSFKYPNPMDKLDLD